MLTDVGAVLVTVVPVATMVMGAGVIVVVLSTVAGGKISLPYTFVDCMARKNSLVDVRMTGEAVKLEVTELQCAVLVSVEVTVALSGVRLARLATLRLATCITLVIPRLILARRVGAGVALADAMAAEAIERRPASAVGSATSAAKMFAQSSVSV